VYSGEYDVCDVTLRVTSQTSNWTLFSLTHLVQLMLMSQLSFLKLQVNAVLV
jgi:hypothetical protein